MNKLIDFIYKCIFLLMLSQNFEKIMSSPKKNV